MSRPWFLGHVNVRWQKAFVDVIKLGSHDGNIILVIQLYPKHKHQHPYKREAEGDLTIGGEML